MAKQSNLAAGDISRKITGTQGNTGSASEIISQMVSVIDIIKKSSEEIQTATGDAIANNVKEAANGVEETDRLTSEMSGMANKLAASSTQIATGADEVAKVMGQADAGTSIMIENTEKVKTQIASLSGITGSVNEIVGQFRLN
ncbi:MAG: hypothetical protein QNL04_10920 [SAR324 cluster bacterium]|nr:hypothetical protein [SAR324 cluster bacterium]